MVSLATSLLPLVKEGWSQSQDINITRDTLIALTIQEILDFKDLDARRVKVEVLVAQWCSTLSDPMECSSTDSSVPGISQARILEWEPFPSPGDLPNPEVEPGSPASQADSLPSEPPELTSFFWMPEVGTKTQYIFIINHNITRG